jgi:outer membrane protein
MGQPNSDSAQMKTLLLLPLVFACGALSAQTPTTNPMPDGSRDMYVGLGVVSAPDYPGASEKQVAALPLIQVEWSNGMFISGMSAGMHLSGRSDLEYGPLATYDSGRDDDGDNGQVGSPVMGFQTGRRSATGQGLGGMRELGPRLQLGGFLNYYLTPSLRLTNTLLYGAGHERNGLLWNAGVQQVMTEVAPHHRLSVSAGVNLVNRRYNAAYFGVTPEEALLSGHTAYAPKGGLRDVYVAAGWNWALSPSWMVASSARLAYLRGAAGHSPLVERPTNFTVSTGLVYRF